MAVYSLVAGRQGGAAIQADIVLVKPVRGTELSPDEIYVSGQGEDVRRSARRGGWIAYQELKQRRLICRKSKLPKSGVTFDFAGNTMLQIDGPSAGLFFLIRMAEEIVEEFLRSQGKEVPACDFAATGILDNFSHTGNIGYIEEIEKKIRAALVVLQPGGIVFYPQANAPLDCKLHQAARDKHITLVAVNTPRAALDCLLKQYGNPASYDSNWPLIMCLILGLVGCLLLPILVWLAVTGRFLAIPSEKSPPGIQPLASYDRGSQADAPSSPVSALSLCAQPALFYKHAAAEEGEGTHLPEGKALTKGNIFRVRLEVDRDCYPYVFEVDSAHRMEWVFPSTPHVRSRPQGVYWAPEDGEWLRLDDVRGEETVLVFAAAQPSDWLEKIREQITQSKGLPTSERQELSTRLREYLEREAKAQRGTVVRQTFRHE